MDSSLIETSPANDDFEARMRWRKRLPEHVVRELAVEYMQGHRDQCNTDAYHEFLERFGDPAEARAERARQRQIDKQKAKKRRR